MSDAIKLARSLKVIPNNCQLSEKTVIKYFGSFENLNKELKNGENGK